MKSFWQRGFTFIELLVVISIIAILSAVVYASFGDARDSARNKAFKAELKEVQLALELYKAQNGSYPLPVDDSCRGGSYVATTNNCGDLPIIDDLIPEFITALPDVDADSGNSNCHMRYQTDTTGTWYKLSAARCITGEELMTFESEMARCPERCESGGDNWCDDEHIAFQESFAVYSLGGECEQ